MPCYRCSERLAVFGLNLDSSSLSCIRSQSKTHAALAPKGKYFVGFVELERTVKQTQTV